MVTPLPLQVYTGTGCHLDSVVEVRSHSRRRCWRDFPTCSSPRSRPASTILYVNQSTALGCEDACSRPAAGSQEEEWIGIKLGWEEGRKELPSTRLREAGGRSPRALSEQFPPYKEVMTDSIAASWGQPGPAGEEGHADLWVSERKEPGSGLCSDFLCDSPTLSGCHISHLFK